VKRKGGKAGGDEVRVNAEKEGYAQRKRDRVYQYY